MSIVELLKIELPLIQAPMAGVQDSALAIAVSNAGALGSVPCAMLNAAGIHNEITAVTAQTNKPFNINFFCHTAPVIDHQREATWRDALTPYYRELGIDISGVPAGAGRTPFNAEAAAVLEQLRPPVVSFHFGLPGAELLSRVKATRAKIIASATTVNEARWLEAHGVDAIVAQGVEAGGHRGMFLSDDVTTQVGTLALVPQVVRAVRLPVIAAGGIADARGVAAAMRLGAAGVQVGTAYLLCPEATTTAVHRRALGSDRAAHTVLTNVFTGRPARGIVNRLIRELGPMSARVPAFPLATAAVMPLRAAAEAHGSDDFSPLWAGQNTSGCADVPARDLTRQLADGFRN